jgi:hypothetical protein
MTSTGEGLADMAVTTRTNRATNPNVGATATNYTAFPGTGATAAGARVNSAGWDNKLGFYRITWSVASTAVSGGSVYTQTGLLAATQYTHSLYVRPSVTQTMSISAQYKDAAAANVGVAVLGTSVTCPANQWTRLSVTSTSGALVDRVTLTAGARAGGVVWPISATLDTDAVLIESASTLGTYFDGAYTNAAGVFYSWAAAVDGSNSLAVTYVPTITLAPGFGAPCDRVTVTIADLPATPQTVTIWRTADGERQAVRGYRKIEVVTSDSVEDYEAPMYRVLTYELEILAGTAQGAATPNATTSLDPGAPRYGWIQDPLDPTSSIKVYGDIVTGAETTLMDEAIKQIEYPADVTLIPILGNKKPVALLGQRMAASGVSFKMGTNSAGQASALRNLLGQAPLALIRTVPEWGAALPGLCYIAPPTPAELPKNEAWGGSVIEWNINSPLVAAPTMAVVVAIWSYGTVEPYWATYQQAQNAFTGKTYLYAKTNPAG